MLFEGWAFRARVRTTLSKLSPVGRLRIRAVQISGRTGCWTEQLAECVEENAGQQNRVGCLLLPLSIYLPWSRAVYPTQAKKRLEWGTQLLLPVRRECEVVRTAALTSTPCARYVGMRGSHDGSSHTHPLYLQQRLGAPFKPFFGLSGIYGSRPGVGPPNLDKTGVPFRVTKLTLPRLSY